ncbi:MAG: hypothetical protein ACUVSU_09150 [Aggregatilineaceae bacterium]
MLPRRSKYVVPLLNNAPLPRLQLITGRELAGVAVALLVLLVLIFPNRRLFEELLGRSVPDDLSIAYLENLLRYDPHNLDLRLLLARAKAGRADDDTLESLLVAVELNGSPAQRSRAMQIRLRALLDAYHAGHLLLSAPQIDARLSALAEGERASADLAMLADSALQLGRTELAWRLYLRLARQEPEHYREWIEPAAQRSLEHGHYRLAANLYFLARHGAKRAEARRLFMAGVNALMAGNLFTEAMTEAERHLGELDTDAETLRFLIHSARAANDNSRAANYARRLLERQRRFDAGGER